MTYNPASGGPVGPVEWSAVADKPATFPAEAHEHAESDVTGLGSDLTGKADATVVSTHVGLTTTAHGGLVASSDARLTDARAPTAHTHLPGDVTGTAVVTADARLSDARTPLAHTHAPADLGTGTPGAANYLRGDGSWQGVTAALPDLLSANLGPSADETILAGFGVYVPDAYEIANTYATEIASDAVLEIG